ncbi:MAG: glycosyltransferase family 2 protein [Cyanobacteria bacterium P01_A01_bin.37]
MNLPNSLNETQPLVSVITPTYQRPEYLREAIASAVSQTYHNIEIIVSDNFSPDNPLPMIEEFNDPRIKFFRNDQNVGMLANVVGAFQKSTGKYVASLLDDDAWQPDFLEKMVLPLEKHPEASIAFCDHYVVDEYSQIDSIKTERCSQQYKRDMLSAGLHKPFYELALVHQAVSPAIAAVIRRDVINWDTLPADIGPLWDIYLAYLSSADGHAGYYVPERLTRYREHSNTETMQSGRTNVSAKLAKAQAGVFCYQTFLNDERLAVLHPDFERRLAHHLTTLGVAMMRMSQTQDARPHLLESLRTQLNLRTAAALVVSFLPEKLALRF